MNREHPRKPSVFRRASKLRFDVGVVSTDSAERIIAPCGISSPCDALLLLREALASSWSTHRISTDTPRSKGRVCPIRVCVLAHGCLFNPPEGTCNMATCRFPFYRPPFPFPNTIFPRIRPIARCFHLFPLCLHSLCSCRNSILFRFDGDSCLFD